MIKNILMNLVYSGYNILVILAGMTEDKLLKMTEEMEIHPDWYPGPCNCNDCKRKCEDEGPCIRDYSMENN
jgi:hypothetical protein